jgi:AbrB family looped-hinge helix DNA binding protein
MAQKSKHPFYTQIWTKVDNHGRIVIPAEFREELVMQPGEKVRMWVEGRQLRMMSQRRSLEEAQEIVARHVPRDVSLVDELIAERRAEAARE